MKNSSKLVLTPKFWALIDKDPNLVKEYRAILFRVFLILMTMILPVLMSPSWYLPSSLQDLNPSKKSIQIGHSLHNLETNLKVYLYQHKHQQLPEQLQQPGEQQQEDLLQPQHLPLQPQQP